MTKKGLSRREFLGGAAVVAGVAALPMITSVTTAAASPAPTVVNFPITLSPWVPLDPKACARRAWETYKGMYNGFAGWPTQTGCCEATYAALLVSLAAVSAAQTGPLTGFDAIPLGTFNYGSGGINGFGSVCGAPNGGSAILKQLGAPAAVTNNFLVWYEKTALPSNAAYLDYKSTTWTPGGKSLGVWGGTGCPIPLNNIPKSKAGSVLCHVSLTKWRAAADSYMQVYGDQNSDRCGKICYDTAFYLATLINSWKAGAVIDGALSWEASSAGCRNASCHGGPVVDDACPTTAQGTMKCTPCHTQRVGDGHNL